MLCVVVARVCLFRVCVRGEYNAGQSPPIAMPGPEIEKMTTRCCGQRASRPDMALVKAAVGVLAGLFLALSGLATYVFFPAILKTQVELVSCPYRQTFFSFQRTTVMQNGTYMDKEDDSFITL